MTDAVAPATLPPMVFGQSLSGIAREIPNMVSP